uniref:Uncharacterized protein n=1 Tax=Homalodisca liturata TaxID=320908 RepID=A0A1B6IK23_9HEMI
MTKLRGSVLVVLVNLYLYKCTDDVDLVHLKPIKPIFDELGLQDKFPQLEDDIKKSILKERNQTHNLLHYMKYFHEKVNSVYNMVRSPEDVNLLTKTLIEKLLKQIGPWFSAKNFDDNTLSKKYNLNKKQIDDYHEMHASSKIMLHLIEKILKENRKERERFE